jgi:SAM-dependent methyltransferase
MEDQRLRATQASYDRVAREYAGRIADELAGKPLDRALLRLLAEQAGALGPICDLGCGPGHVARFLRDCGAEACGVDLAPEMVAQARRLQPGIQFQVGNMLALDWADESFGGVAAFYSIIHAPAGQLPQAFREMRRVLRPGGRALVAFHIGHEAVHLDEWWGERVDLDFQFLEPERVIEDLRAAGLEVESITTRAPYPGVEHASRRAYIFAHKLTG